MDQRFCEVVQPLVRPGERVCAFFWDSHPIDINKSENHLNSRMNYSSKDKEPKLHRMEAATIGGMPIFSLPVTSSSSPLATDESIMDNILRIEEAAGTAGGLLDLMMSIPGYKIVHVFDKGFK